MSKGLKTVVALVVVLSLCVSMCGLFTVGAVFSSSIDEKQTISFDNEAKTAEIDYITENITAYAFAEDGTIKAIYKSADTSITSFVIEKKSLKFADSDVNATIDNNTKTISMVYPYGNVDTAKVPAVVTVAEGASISPNPAEARDQSTAKYIVTSENGDTAEYTVKITISNLKPLVPIDLIEFEIDDQYTGFNSSEKQAALNKAVLDEYNHQRSLGFDLDEVAGSFQDWNSCMNRLPFSSPMSTSDFFGQFRAMITADIPYGLAYTIKNDMFKAWEILVTVGQYGYQGYAYSGGAAENEFTMDGRTYQQFTLSYGVASADSKNRVIRGIGTLDYNPLIYNPFIDSLQGTSWEGSYKETQDRVTADFRNAYELANVYGINPGVALDGNLKYNAENNFMYQVFTGTDETKKTTRDKSKRSIIVSADPDAEAFVMAGDFKTVYDNISGVVFKDVTLDGFTFKYSGEIGLPTRPAIIGRNGELVLQFKDIMATADPDDLTKVVLTEGSYYSSEAEVLDIEFEYEAKSIAFDHDQKRIDIVFKGEIDLSNVVIKSITLSEGATSSKQAGYVLNLSNDADYITVTAEDGSNVTYDVYGTYDGTYYSSEAEILDIEFEYEAKSIAFDHDQKRIDIVFKGEIDLSNVVIKSITLSEGATSSKQAGYVLNLSNDADYITVTAEDGSNVTYDVYGTYDGTYYSSEAEILDIEFEYDTKNIIFNHDDKRIDVVFKGEIDLSNAVIKSITLSEGATSSKQAGYVLNLSNDADYITVTAEDGSTVTYDVYGAYDGSDDDKLAVGDVNKDKMLTVTDIVSLRAVIMDNVKLSDDDFRICDVNEDGKITVTDIVSLRALIMGN